MTRYIDEHRERFGVEPICQTLDVSASAYYQRATSPRSEREIEDERLLAVIRTTHKDNFEAYGYRKLWKALIRAGETAPRCRVQRLMATNAIVGAKRRGKQEVGGSSPSPPIRKNACVRAVSCLRRR